MDVNFSSTCVSNELPMCDEQSFKFSINTEYENWKENKKETTILLDDLSWIRDNYVFTDTDEHLAYRELQILDDTNKQMTVFGPIENLGYKIDESLFRINVPGRSSDDLENLLLTENTKRNNFQREISDLKTKNFQEPQKITAASEEELLSRILKRSTDTREISKFPEITNNLKNEPSQKNLPINDDIIKPGITRRLLSDLSMNIFDKNTVKLEFIDYSTVDNENNALIHWACFRKNMYLLDLCIKNKVDVNLRGKNRLTPLIYLFMKERHNRCNKKTLYDMTKLLLENNVDINIVTTRLDFLAFVCKNYLHEAPLKLLLNSGIPVNTKESCYKSALDYAYMRDDPSYDAFELLILNGAVHIHTDENNRYIETKIKFISKFRLYFSSLLRELLQNITEKWIHLIIAHYFI